MRASRGRVGCLKVHSIEVIVSKQEYCWAVQAATKSSGGERKDEKRHQIQSDGSSWGDWEWTGTSIGRAQRADVTYYVSRTLKKCK